MIAFLLIISQIHVLFLYFSLPLFFIWIPQSHRLSSCWIFFFPNPFSIQQLDDLRKLQIWSCQHMLKTLKDKVETHSLIWLIPFPVCTGWVSLMQKSEIWNVPKSKTECQQVAQGKWSLEHFRFGKLNWYNANIPKFKPLPLPQNIVQCVNKEHYMTISWHSCWIIFKLNELVWC